MFDIISLCMAIVTPLATLIGVLWAIYQYKREATRKKRSETLSLYIDLFSKVYDTREEYIKMTKENLFDSDKIHGDSEFCKKILTLLTHFESFAKGLEYEIYDFEIFIYLTPKEMFEILNSLKQFVYDERKIKGYDLLFNDFIHLVDLMSICIQKKTSHKKFKKKYKKI
ncbi:MAG: hypothetical protein HDR21_09720 [Lachnospiraceae bacterium]|nr:hypothetical protein [Lachnospiraceae bacterium]MBD5483292.1 hypothetical protein [Lachnospiraceae bacterium]